MRAGEIIPYGSICIERDGELFVGPAITPFYGNSGHMDVIGPEEMIGVAHRPLGAGIKHAYEVGDDVELVTEGALLCELGSGETAYCRVVDGRIRGIDR